VTRVLILAEVGLYRDALGGALGRGERIEVAGAAATLEEALVAVEDLAPDIVLVDTRMPASADAVRTLVAAAPRVKVVALAVPEVERNVIAFAEAGASGLVPREGSIQDLVTVIESVSRGEMLGSPGIAATLARHVADLARERRLEPIEDKLTARELDVLGLIEEGFSNKQIAGALSIELPTVKNHVHNILQKLDVDRRTEAAARARRHGLQRLGGG
jgi:two-component system nitrate/nitrite response regulator NarL